jgi:hypothetical protein
MNLERTLAVCAWLACGCVAGMIGIFVAAGVGQDPLQFVHPGTEYAQLLLKNPPALRACLALDNFFVVFYASVFLLLGLLLLRDGATRGLVFVSLGLMAALALLDFIENFHFMVMLAEAEQGLVPSSTEISAQVFESLLKFHVSYLALVLLGFALPRRTAKERLLANLCVFVQLPVGILIYVVPRALAVPLVFTRFAFFLTALILVGSIFGRPIWGTMAPSNRAEAG